jgi:hypothetical protein
MSQSYKAAQSFLMNHLGDPRTAAEQFRWPELDRFNWALDWFDAQLAAAGSMTSSNPPTTASARLNWRAC